MNLLPLDPNTGYIGTHLYIPKTAVNAEGVKKTLTFEIYDQESVRMLYLYEEGPHHLMVPRSLWDLAAFPKIPFIDLRPKTYARTGIKSRIKLDHRQVGGRLAPTGKTLQRDALASLLNCQGGTLQLGCGKGKTVVALELAARLQVPTLILVDNTHLMHQWREAIEQFLEVPGGVGIIQGDKREWRKSVVVGTYQTLANWADSMGEGVRRWFGLIIPDEGHHIGAPIFSKSAPLFYGKRVALTATPERADGAHVVCLYHIGKVVHKDVRQETPPAISFKWTGLSLDHENIKVMAAVNDMNGDVHLRKLAGHLGQWRERLNILLGEFHKAVDEGRKVIVLSHSVAEVVNLMALWGDDKAELYSGTAYPTPQELGLTGEPIELHPIRIAKLKTLIHDITHHLAKTPDIPPNARARAEAKLEECRTLLEGHEIHKKLERVYEKRLREYVKVLISKPSTAGLFTYGVKPAVRMKMLRERRIIFAIMKYGREGLDDKDLDTVFMSGPVSDRNTIQQIMGRPRDKGNAKLIIFEDDIGPLLGQCKKMRKHFRNWPIDEGGPFPYRMDGHPSYARATYTRPHLRTNQ
jgi:hypothetical protein